MDDVLFNDLVESIKEGGAYLRGEKAPSRVTRISPDAETETFADMLDGYIGVLSSSEHVPGGANMSVDTRRQFAAGLVKRREQGRL